MTRLIDADALLPMMKYATTDSEIGVFPIKIGFNAIAKVIEDAPTVDAVPVIRCKDCKFAYLTDGVYGNNPEVKYCDIWFPNVSEYMPINYYCASAERKEE